jgi:E3 ubiquitin ligase
MHTGNLHPAQYYWLGAALCATVALWALYRCFRNLWRNRLVSDTPLVRIRSAAQGYVKLSGRAAAVNDKPLAAPLSSLPCVWWRYQVDQKTRNAKGETRWEIIDSGTSIDLFVLADGDDRCLVGPVNAEITPTTCNVWHGALPRPAGAPMSSAALPQEGDFRYTEELLSAGDRLSVLGELRSHSEIGDPEDSVAALLHQWKQDQKGLLARFDKDHDGRLDATEWDAVRQAAEAESRSKTLDSRINRLNVISQPTNGEPFLVASMDDAHLVRRERLHAALFFVLGLFSIVLCASAVEHAHMAGEAASRGVKQGGDVPIDITLWALFCVGGALASRIRSRVT